MTKTRLPLAPGLRVGLFGGSFDPAHTGHLHAARTAMARMKLDRVVWLVSPGNPLKPERADDLARRMAQTRQVARAPGMIVSGIEARLGTRYTLDTLRALKARHPGVRFVWIMGADALAQIHLWRGWREIFCKVPVCVVARPGQALRARLSPAARRFASARRPARAAASVPDAAPPAWVYLEAPWNFLSSTRLRAVRE